MYKKQLHLFKCGYMKLKNRSHRYDINRPRLRHGHKNTKYKMCHCIMMVIGVLSNTLATFEVQFMKKLSNTEKKRSL